MFKKIKIYIVFFQIKYFLVFLLLILTLIWLSQILRLIDLKFSIATQIFDIIFTTLLVLPSFVNPLMPIVLLISYFFLNYSLSISNEGIVLNQYLNKKQKLGISLIAKLILILFFFLNNEYFSPKLYKIYKYNELDLRNNLKLGVPTKNEFHIGSELSIFFQKAEKNKFIDVEAVLRQDDQFIKAKIANIEYNKSGFNITFIDGIRIMMNENEKSKTVFERFIYNIEVKGIEELTYDKEHFNTYQLINYNEDKLRFHGHNKIINYLIFIYLIIISQKIIFKNSIKKINFKLYNLTFCLLIFLIFINYLSLFELNKGNINIYFFYLLNLISLISFHLLISKFYADK